ncbi:MAG: hypothetical protein ABI847_15845 [Anaerolineales bacterium]
MVTSFQKWLRSRTARAAVLPVVLAVSVMLGTTPAFARAERTVLAGTETKNFGPAQRVWSAGPWDFHRDATLYGTFDFGALKGTLVWVATDRFDFSTGNGRVWGKVSYTDTASGVVCSGTGQGPVTGFLLTAQIVAKCSDGSQLKGTLQDVSNDLVGLHSTFHGELLSH